MIVMIVMILLIILIIIITNNSYSKYINFNDEALGVNVKYFIPGTSSIFNTSNYNNNSLDLILNYTTPSLGNPFLRYPLLYFMEPPSNSTINAAGYITINNVIVNDYKNPTVRTLLNTNNSSSIKKNLINLNNILSDQSQSTWRSSYLSFGTVPPNPVPLDSTQANKTILLYISGSDKVFNSSLSFDTTYYLGYGIQYSTLYPSTGTDYAYVSGTYFKYNYSSFKYTRIRINSGYDRNTGFINPALATRVVPNNTIDSVNNVNTDTQYSLK